MLLTEAETSFAKDLSSDLFRFSSDPLRRESLRISMVTELTGINSPKLGRTNPATRGLPWIPILGAGLCNRVTAPQCFDATRNYSQKLGFRRLHRIVLDHNHPQVTLAPLTHDISSGLRRCRWQFLGGKPLCSCSCYLACML